MAVDADTLRSTMRSWATGVTVVTSQHSGIRHGMTVNSFTSVSLEPPLVMVSLERISRTHKLVEKAGIFGITVLADFQLDVSDCFAGRYTEQEDRFSNLKTFTMVTGAAFIEGGLAFMDCRVVSTFEAGTHTLFIGEVVATRLGNGDKPLIRFNRSYRELQK